METTRRVNDLKAALAKELGHEEGDSDLERCIELLTELDQCSITLNILSKTLVGAVVTKFRRYRDDDISKKAKLLIKKWKKLAKIGQVESKPASASASASSAPRSSLAQVSTTAPGSNSADSSEWDHLPQLRRNIASKLNQTLLLSSKNLKLGMQTSSLSSLCTSLATEIEVEMDILNKGDKATYTNKVRSLIFNLKKNSSLCENILLGSISVESLSKMTPDQLATSEKTKARSKMVNDIQESRRLDWEQANESKINEMCGITGDLLNASLFTCGRCNSIKTTSTQKQTRSADEPMTVFVLCLDCGKRWKC